MGGGVSKSFKRESFEPSLLGSSGEKAQDYRVGVRCFANARVIPCDVGGGGGAQQLTDGRAGRREIGRYLVADLRARNRLHDDSNIHRHLQEPDK